MMFSALVFFHTGLLSVILSCKVCSDSSGGSNLTEGTAQFDDQDGFGIHHMHGRFIPNANVDSESIYAENGTTKITVPMNTLIATSVAETVYTLSINKNVVQGIHRVAPLAPYGGAGGPFGLTNIGIAGSNINADPSEAFLLPGLPDHIGRLMTQKPCQKTATTNPIISSTKTSITTLHGCGSNMMGILNFIEPSMSEEPRTKIIEERVPVSTTNVIAIGQNYSSSLAITFTTEPTASMWSIF